MTGYFLLAEKTLRTSRDFGLVAIESIQWLLSPTQHCLACYSVTEWFAVSHDSCTLNRSTGSHGVLLKSESYATRAEALRAFNQTSL